MAELTPAPNGPDERLARWLHEQTPQPSMTLNGADIRALRPLPGRSQPRAGRRWLPAAAAAMIVVALGAVLALTGRLDSNDHPTHSASSGTASWPTYRWLSQFTVKYAPGWQPYRTDYAGSFTTGIVAFSTEHVPAVCHTTTVRGSQITSCGSPTVPLSGQGVVIFWTLGGFPRGAHQPSAVDDAPGTRTTIDNRPAKIAVQPATASCRRSNGDRTISITIGADTTNAYYMDACLHATGHQLDNLTNTVIASARTAHLTR